MFCLILKFVQINTQWKHLRWNKRSFKDPKPKNIFCSEKIKKTRSSPLPCIKARPERKKERKSMAAFVIKSLVSQITAKHSPSDHTSSRIEIKSALISVKRRCGSKIPVLAASIHSENDQSIEAQKKKNGNAKNIQSNLLQDAEYDVASKDAHPSTDRQSF